MGVKARFQTAIFDEICIRRSTSPRKASFSRCSPEQLQ